MKSVISLLILILITSSCKKDKIIEPKSVSSDFSYLIGDWERTNDEDGKNTFEHWRSNHSKGLHGSSYTLQEGDTIFKETFRLFKKDTTWTLRIFAVHETPIDFTVTQRNQYSFTAENPKNEFPSIISYNYFDDVLTAKISGEAMDISFIYWRVED